MHITCGFRAMDCSRTKPDFCKAPMKQFDVMANPFPRSRERQPFLVALQSDLLVRSLDTVVVAPLESAASGTFADRLNPRVEVDGRSFVLVAQELVTVRKSVLGNPRGSIAAARDAIIAALDLLFTGF
jgi:toxin CcdB